MGVNSLPKTVTRQRRDCDLNPGPSAPESSTLTTLLPSQPFLVVLNINELFMHNFIGVCYVTKMLHSCLVLLLYAAELHDF